MGFRSGTAVRENPAGSLAAPKKLGGHDYNINLLEKSGGGGGAQFLGVNLTHS